MSDRVGDSRRGTHTDRDPYHQRNGSPPQTLTTAAGDVTVAIPKTRTGPFFPSLLEPRRRIDRALHAVISEAYVHGVSTRKARSEEAVPTKVRHRVHVVCPYP